MRSLVLIGLSVVASSGAGQDPCLKLYRGDRSATDACIQFEVERLGDPLVAQAAVQSLNGIGEPAIAALLTAAKGTDGLRRSGAVDALSRIGMRVSKERKEEIVNAFVEAMGDPEARVRREAVGGLVRAGSGLVKARTALEHAAAEDEDEIVRKLASDALAQFQ